MKCPTVFALVALGGVVCVGGELPRSSPEAQGVSSRELLDFVRAADETIESMNSVMLVRHGHVVAEGWWSPYGPDSPHSLYSLSKSFTATAVGLAIAEGKLRLDDEVLKFFPEDAPADPGANLKAMRIHDLLRMSTGHQTEPPRKNDEPWTRTFLAHPVPFKPGTHFLYNTSATYMLSAILQKATGQTLLDYLRPRLFEPLGIVNPTWESSPQGVTAGGYGLSIRTEDIARFGQLYLQKGRWQGRQLVPEWWVEAATSLQTSNGSNPKSDWDQGYGYQFWRSRHGAYRGDGAFGQYCIVLPEQDAVVAITSGVRDMQAVLNLVWDKLLPALKPATLEPDEKSRSQLEQALKALSLRPQEGSGSPVAVAGKTFAFPENRLGLESLVLEDQGAEGATLVVRFDGAERRLPIPRGAWKKGRLAWSRFPEQPVAASGAWVEDGTFAVKLCFYETPFILSLRLKFSGEEVRLESEANVAFGPRHEPPLVGTAKAAPEAGDGDRASVEAVQDVIRRGLEFLARDAMAWKAERKCVSCHHAAMVVWSLREAKDRGFAVQEPVLAEMTRWMANSGDGRTDIARPVGRPRALNTKALWFAAALATDPRPDEDTQAGMEVLQETLRSDQTEDGSYSTWPDSRPPMLGDADQTATALAALALLPAAQAGDAEARAVRDKAIGWLAATKSDEDPQADALRLVLWRRMGLPTAESEPLLKRIRARQNRDGGWGQVPGAASDAWATGQALYALAHAGVAADDPAVARGRAFLVRTQREDGSWPMASRPAQPGGEGAKDLVPITAAGSAWAVLGLVRGG